MLDDPLLAWRKEFPILDTCTYLVTHSLGAMPRRASTYLQQFADEWSTRGVRAWYEGWWEIGRTTGDLLAPVLGVSKGTISMHQNVTVALGVIGSCHRFDGARNRIVMTDLEFPSNMYLFEGFRKYGAEIVYVPSPDAMRTDLQRLLDAIDERTALVPLSFVLFKSAYIQNAAAVIEKAHRVGARVILDVYQAAGTVPLEIERLGADFAVGGSVKWLCGGPGAGYLYVRPDLANELEPGIVGWAAHAHPFEFAAGAIEYAPSPERFQSGTPNVPSLYSARAGYEIVAEIGVRSIREKSLRLTRRLMDLARDAGFRVNTPDVDAERGGSVIVDVPNGHAVAEELIRREVIVDYRPGAGIRMAPHFYNTLEEVDHAMAYSPRWRLRPHTEPVGSRSRTHEDSTDSGTRRRARWGTGSRMPRLRRDMRRSLYDVAAPALDKGQAAIEAVISKGVELGKVAAGDAAAMRARLSTTTDLASALDGADFVIEAAPERIDLKLSLMADIERLAPQHAVIATNTSALSITELAGSLARPSRVGGMHFFNPVHKMKLIEIIQPLESAPETLQSIEEVARAMGKETVLVRESPGFITTRVNASLGNEAFYMLMEGVASARDIDKALKLGLNHPMGPFELVDLVGLDTRLSILEYLHRTMGEKYRPCPLLAQYVKAGRLGRKVGKGVYEY